MCYWIFSFGSTCLFTSPYHSLSLISSFHILSPDLVNFCLACHRRSSPCIQSFRFVIHPIFFMQPVLSFTLSSSFILHIFFMQHILSFTLSSPFILSIHSPFQPSFSNLFLPPSLSHSLPPVPVPCTLLPSSSSPLLSLSPTSSYTHFFAGFITGQVINYV